MARLIIPAFFLLVLIGCSPVSKKVLTKKFAATEEKFQDLTGFMLYDPAKKETIFEYNSNKHFIPASNTKIFTLFACLKTIGDSIPALKYIELGDSLIFWGTGDPSFLYRETFTNDRVFSFLKGTRRQLYFSNANFHTSHYGAGWAWDDYNDYYQAERSPLPVYGNIVSVKLAAQTVFVDPPFFKNHFQAGILKNRPEVQRDVDGNLFRVHPGKVNPDKSWNVPFRVSQELIADLLQDTLRRSVLPVNTLPHPGAKVFYSIPSDSLYKTMMQESDNFIAEQLLMICASILADSLQPEIAIRRITEAHLSDLPDAPKWVDGSGLSRYNLFTPRTVVRVWEKIYETVPKERLFKLVAIGGQAGTIKGWYKGEKPFVFGKTGTLSNNHSLSGFLVAKSGRVLIFSFMNTNFTASVNEIRKNMQSILTSIYEHY